MRNQVDEWIFNGKHAELYQLIAAGKLNEALTYIHTFFVQGIMNADTYSTQLLTFCREVLDDSSYETLLDIRLSLLKSGDYFFFNISQFLLALSVNAGFGELIDDCAQYIEGELDRVHRTLKRLLPKLTETEMAIIGHRFLDGYSFWATFWEAKGNYQQVVTQHKRQHLFLELVLPDEEVLIAHTQSLIVSDLVRLARKSEDLFAENDDEKAESEMDSLWQEALEVFAQLLENYRQRIDTLYAEKQRPDKNLHQILGSIDLACQGFDESQIQDEQKKLLVQMRELLRMGIKIA